MGFPRQEYWSGLPFSSPGDLPNPRMEPRSPALTGGLFTTELPGKPNVCIPLTNSYVKILTPLSDSIRRRDLRKGLGPALMNGTGPLIKKPHRAPKGFPGGQTVKSLPVMQETRVQSLGREDPLEEGMAAHSSILSWRIPWTEEPSGLQSMGSQRVRHY